MKDFKIKYKVTLEAGGRLGGINRFEVDFAMRSIIRLSLQKMLDESTSFATLFRGGEYDINIELEELRNNSLQKEKLKSKKVKSTN